MLLLTLAIGIDVTIEVRVEFLVYIHPAFRFLDVDTILFTPIYFDCHNFYLRWLHVRSGDNRYGCQCFS